MRQRPDGKWQARIGGRMRGETRVFLSRALAIEAVHRHYNRVLMDWINAHEARRER